MTLTITGGTDVAWSMPVDYFQHVLMPAIQRWTGISCQVLRRGYYPKGGGSIRLAITPKLHCREFISFLSQCRQGPHINLTNPGTLIAIKGVSHASKDLQYSNVAERQASSAKTALAGLPVGIDIRTEYADTLSTGSGITLWAVFAENDEETTRLGADALGARGTPAEQVGADAARKLLTAINSRAAVDAHLADNLVPWVALFAPGKLTAEHITQHTRTNILVTERFFGKCSVSKNTLLCE